MSGTIIKRRHTADSTQHAGVVVVNAQRAHPVDIRQTTQLMGKAIRALGVRARGRFEVTFIGPGRMRRLNRRFLGHDWATDVLSFRYEGARSPHTVGEILIAPAAARAYAKRHRLSYEDELARYVVHGLLHWCGYEDATPAQQRTMRQLEHRLLRLPLPHDSPPHHASPPKGGEDDGEGDEVTDRSTSRHHGIAHG